MSSLRAAATIPTLRPLAAMIRERSADSLVPARVCWQASIAAQRTNFEPCFVIGPRCTVVSDSRWRGVSPAQQHNFSGRENRLMSPISATNTAAKVGPIPLICWIAGSRGAR